MDNSVILISFIVCAFGLIFFIVYMNPFGLVVDSLGFMLFIYGLKKEDSQELTPYIKEKQEKKAIKNEAFASVTKDLVDAKHKNMVITLINMSTRDGYLNPELRVDKMISDKMAVGKTREQAIEELYYKEKQLCG